VLAALLPLFERCKEPLRAQHIGNALWGLQCCSIAHPEVLALLMQILRESRIDLVRDVREYSQTCLTSLAQGSAAFLLQWHAGNALASLADGVCRCLTAVYDASSHELARRTPDSGSSQSRSEAALLARAKACFAGHPRIAVRPAACFLHGFEADIVIDVRPPSGGNLATFNVEVDGPTHRVHPKERLVAVRDPHMKACGVRVLRWDLLQDNAFGQNLEAWLRREVCSVPT
jgi:hypothetical protein